jgi:hypothetical protein
VNPNPCPAYGAVTIGLPFLGQTSGGSLQVVDSRGRVVADLPAARTVRWNPGNRITPGVYFIRWMQGNALRGLKRLVIM